MDDRSEYRILLVDDEKPVLDALQRNLRNQGYKLDVFDMPQDALGACKQNQYDLIISDFKMPDMDGLMLLKLIKNVLPDSIRFLLTSHTEAEQLIDAVRQNIVHKFILKPWDPSELRFLVSRALSEV